MCGSAVFVLILLHDAAHCSSVQFSCTLLRIAHLLPKDVHNAGFYFPVCVLFVFRGPSKKLLFVPVCVCWRDTQEERALVCVKSEAREERSGNKSLCLIFFFYPPPTPRVVFGSSFIFSAPCNHGILLALGSG